jgi:hypothetical protein
MITKRFVLFLLAFLATVPLSGCGCRRNCNSSGSFAPPPCNSCNSGALPPGAVPAP